MQPNRVAIWSVLEEDQRWYAWLFPGLWLGGTLYHAYLLFWGGSDEALALLVGEFMKDIGFVGLASAILALMIIAARRLFMALFDWRNSEKSRTEGREQADKEWDEWTERRDAAIKAGWKFTEPSPAERRKQPA